MPTHCSFLIAPVLVDPVDHILMEPTTALLTFASARVFSAPDIRLPQIGFLLVVHGVMYEPIR